MSQYPGVGRVDVVELLELLDVQNVHRIGRGEVEFSCVFQDGHAFGDSNPSNHMNEDKLVYRCKGCGRAGTVIDLIGSVQRCSPLEALRWLRDHFGESVRLEPGEVAQRIAEKRVSWALNATEVYRLPDEEETIGTTGIFSLDWGSDHEAALYMRERGFDPEKLAEWGFGYDSWTRRVAIPVRDEEGVLVGFKGRTISDHPTKYSVLGDTEDRAKRYGVGYGFGMYDPSSVVFALDRAAAVPGRTIVVNEGELDAFSLHCDGVCKAVAIGTTTISRQQARLLRWHADEIVVFYDDDDAGRAATWGYHYEKDGELRWVPGMIEKLSPYLRIRVVGEHEGDPASMPREEKLRLIDEARSWMQIALS